MTLCQGMRSWLAEADTGKLDTLYAKDQAYEGKETMVHVEKRLYSLAVNPAISKFIVVLVRGSPVQFMLDTGAAVSLVRRDVWDRLGGASLFGLSPWRGRHLVGVEGSTVPLYGMTRLQLISTLQTRHFRLIL